MILYHKVFGAVVGRVATFTLLCHTEVLGAVPFLIAYNILSLSKQTNNKTKKYQADLFWIKTKLLGKSQLGGSLVRDALGRLTWCFM